MLDAERADGRHVLPPEGQPSQQRPCPLDGQLLALP